MAMGAFGAALLEARAGWDPTVAIVVSVAAATAAGAIVGAAAVRAEAPFVAIGTWIVAWLVAFALAAFTGLTGGSQGLPLPEPRVGIAPLALTVRLTPGLQVEFAVVLVAFALGVFAALRRAAFGVALAAARDHRGAAEALGTPVEAQRVRAFVMSALLAGIAGALGVHAAGLADASSFGPLLSVELFVAILIGGEGTIVGPIMGALVLVIVPRAAGVVGSLAGMPRERFEPMIAAVLLVAAVVIGRGGVVGWVSRGRSLIWRRRDRASSDSAKRGLGSPSAGSPPGSTSPTALSSDRASAWPPALADWRPASASHGGAGPSPLTVRAASKAFGGVVALDAVSLDLGVGEIHAIIGPNGSGKTTLLRALAGTIRLDSGAIHLGGLDLTDAPVHERVREGVVRTLQSVTAFPNLRVIDNVSVGAVARRRYGGALRSAIATPLSRKEAMAVRVQVGALLTLVGLAGAGDARPGMLSAADQRFLMIATACAVFPRVLLLDEPAAAMPLPEMRRLAGVVGALRDRGVAVVVVEHNLRFVRRVADVVTVLDAGRVIAQGFPGEIAADPAVIDAYLGPARS